MIECLISNPKTQFVPINPGSRLGRETITLEYITIKAKNLDELVEKVNKYPDGQIIYCEKTHE